MAMGLEYACVHLKYNIPLAIVLTVFYRPLFTRLDLYKVCFLVTIAVVSTIPWDLYLIRHRIWSYPPNVIHGLKLFQIPAEEIFFFFIQTYMVSLLYLIASKPCFHPIYLEPGKLSRKLRMARLGGQMLFAYLIFKGVILVMNNSNGTYMGLIMLWACPFLLLLWTLAYQFVLVLPLSNTIFPILIPSLYLWAVDTFALRRGTWVIERGTKYGVQVWDGLDIEEAVFFVITNMLIVFGLIAFDNAVAVLDSSCTYLSCGNRLPSPWMLVKALMISNEFYERDRIFGLRQAATRLKNKSRSFYLASSVFEGALRVDLVLLYSFCRVADDLVDQAECPTEAAAWVNKFRTYLKMSCEPSDRRVKVVDLHQFVEAEFPKSAHLTLSQIPTNRLSPEPLLELLEGFDQDLQFSRIDKPLKAASWPITDELTLERYGSCVAGTVAELCLDLVFHYHPEVPTLDRLRLKHAARNMGMALQIVNIARDIGVDAKIDRIYLPSTWLKEESCTHQDILEKPEGVIVDRLRHRLLDKAFSLYHQSRVAMADLPNEVRGPMRVAVDSYMEIGRTLRREGYQVKAGRATVPKVRRLWVAWYALNS